MADILEKIGAYKRQEIVAAKARRVLGLDGATPADEATGGPFASDSVMLIVCADGHGDEAESQREQQSSSVENGEGSAAIAVAGGPAERGSARP